MPEFLISALFIKLMKRSKNERRPKWVTTFVNSAVVNLENLVNIFCNKLFLWMCILAVFFQVSIVWECFYDEFLKCYHEGIHPKKVGI